MTAAIGVVWIVSMRCVFAIGMKPDRAVMLARGAICVGHFHEPIHTTGEEWTLGDTGTWDSAWRPRWDPVAKVVPLWMPLAVLAPVTAGSFWRAGRGRARGVCSVCGYSLAGLAPGATCPECGGLRGESR